MRKKNSTDTKINRKYFILITSLIIGLKMLLIGSYFGVILILIGVLAFKYIKKGGYVCFDEKDMILISKKKETRVPFIKITKIEKPLIQGNSYNNWNIFYKNEDDIIVKEKINPLFYYSNFKKFRELVNK